ncbi:anthranilate synthase component II [Opacimonas viscosa]|uniref:Aminodeoxychorismate/anthranilate synthase component II n=1 Tax=Opacimonas viscosa TaxID=2961944 RepID=A0AA41X3E4_9ALTE|nr:aminodeoxychorismate/anthranilate synthase component II [Opacimonas viscosa]MCP3429273.1 aminodeoxychorismate/anthranilate synthase component II [Opacimonas viscosa]
MLLLIDNYDSFTHNLARYFVELGQEVKVVRNDAISCAEIAALNPQYLVLSPGPCTPNESGITLEAIATFAGKIPMLGVCLGHQAIAQVFGAKIIRAKHVLHGKTAKVNHSTGRLFVDIENPFVATRYHSLLIKPDTLSTNFTVTAWCEMDDTREIMAIEDNAQHIYGVQFHPESLLTEAGHDILQNFLVATTPID